MPVERLMQEFGKQVETDNRIIAGYAGVYTVDCAEWTWRGYQVNEQRLLRKLVERFPDIFYVSARVCAERLHQQLPSVGSVISIPRGGNDFAATVSSNLDMFQDSPPCLVQGESVSLAMGEMFNRRGTGISVTMNPYGRDEEKTAVHYSSGEWRGPIVLVDETAKSLSTLTYVLSDLAKFGIGVDACVVMMALPNDKGEMVFPRLNELSLPDGVKAPRCLIAPLRVAYAQQLRGNSSVFEIDLKVAS